MLLRRNSRILYIIFKSNQEKKYIKILTNFAHGNLNTNWLVSFGLYGMNLVFGFLVT